MMTMAAAAAVDIKSTALQHQASKHTDPGTGRLLTYYYYLKSYQPA